MPLVSDYTSPSDQQLASMEGRRMRTKAEPSIEHGRKVETATAVLRSRIATGEFPPGAHLRQDEIADLLGQSRVPVREALKILTAERLLVHHRNRGHFVAELTSAEMSDICWLRESLEGELARTAAPAPERLVTQLEKLNGEIERFLGTPSVQRRVELDDQFHELLWNLSSRPLLCHELRQVAVRQRPYRILMSSRIPDRDSAAVNEHREIIEALKLSDMPRYQALLSLHVRRGREMVAALGTLETSLAAAPPR
jgi:DNA-binding GntR family transcriptional regulator